MKRKPFLSMLLLLNAALFVTTAATTTVAQTPLDLGKAIRNDENKLPSLTSALNSDGTIRRGAVGSFDPIGMRMAFGPNGEPKFLLDNSGGVALEDCDDNWDTRFGRVGVRVNGTVRAIAVSDDDVYIGGSFTQVGDLPANRIARWNGTSWEGLGSGVNGTVA